MHICCTSSKRATGTPPQTSHCRPPNSQPRSVAPATAWATAVCWIPIPDCVRALRNASRVHSSELAMRERLCVLRPRNDEETASGLWPERGDPRWLGRRPAGDCSCEEGWHWGVGVRDSCRRLKFAHHWFYPLPTGAAVMYEQVSSGGSTRAPHTRTRPAHTHTHTVGVACGRAVHGRPR